MKEDKNIAFVMPGQGIQDLNLCRELYEKDRYIQNMFNDLKKYKNNILDLLYSDDKENMNKTSISQPMIYLMDVAVAITLIRNGITPKKLAGFSLGEIAALAIGGAYTIEEGFVISNRRGEIMQHCCDSIETTMLAVINLNIKEVEALCEKVSGAYIANYNCETQIVVSLQNESVRTFSEYVRQNKGRAIQLKVNGGFHSKYMSSAKKQMAEMLKKYVISTPKIETYSNYTGKPYTTNCVETIINQIDKPVKWKMEVERMIQDGIEIFIETGKGKVLTNMISPLA